MAWIQQGTGLTWGDYVDQYRWYNPDTGETTYKDPNSQLTGQFAGGTLITEGTRDGGAYVFLPEQNIAVPVMQDQSGQWVQDPQRSENSSILDAVPYLALGGMAAGVGGLGMGLWGPGAGATTGGLEAGVGAYGGMDAGAVAGADYGAGALGAGGFEYGVGAGPITNAADQVAYGGIPGEVGATMPAAQAMAPGAVAGAQMGGALPELGIEAGMAGAAGAGALGGAALGGAAGAAGAGAAAGNALGGFDWGSLPQNAAGLLQGMDWLGLGSDVLGLNAQRQYQQDLINTMNRAIDYSDPAFAQRGQYQQQFANMQNDPNWMQNDQLLQNMMNQSLRNVSAQNSAQGYMDSGNILHDLTRTANETIAPYGLQRMQQIGEAGGILGGRQNASQAIGSLGQAAGQAGIGQTQSIQSMMGRLPRQQVNTGINNTLGGLFGTF